MFTTFWGEQQATVGNRRASHVRRGPTWQPIGKVKRLKAGEILYAQINGRFVKCGRVPDEEETK